jgi:UDP-N-acetylmuramyl pentapeptide synthase
VAAYGFYPENPQPLSEEVPARGAPTHYYSAQKAELEETLCDALEGADVETYVFRPCVVAGGDALALVEAAREAGMQEESARFFESAEEAARALADFVRAGDLILVKGSRGVHTEKVVEALKTRHELTLNARR